MSNIKAYPNQEYIMARLDAIEKKVEEIESINSLVIKLDTTINTMAKQLENQVITLTKINENITNLNLKQEKTSLQMEQQNERIARLEEESEKGKINTEELIKDFIIKTIIPLGIGYYIMQYMK